MAIRDTMRRINYARKKSGHAIGMAGVLIFSICILVAMILNPLLVIFDLSWSLIGYQAWGDNAWIDSANYQFTKGYLFWPFFGPFGIGCVLYITGSILSIGKTVR